MIAKLRDRVGAVAPANLLAALAVLHVLSSGVAWAMLTPIGGAPDEPSHIAYSSAVVRGQLHGERVVVGADFEGRDVGYAGLFGELPIPVVSIPEWAAIYHRPCFAFDEWVTAECAPPFDRSDEPVRVPTYYAAGLPPTFYALTGLPTLIVSGSSAVYAMRAIAVVVASAAVGLGLGAAGTRQRTWLAVGVLIAVTPAAGHFVGSVNSSSLEIAAALGLGAALFGREPVVRSDRSRAAIAAVALMLLLGFARPRSVLTLAAVIAAGLVINGPALLRWFRESKALRVGVVATGLGAIGYELAVNRSIERETWLVLSEPIGGLGATMAAAVESLGGHTLNLVGLLGWVDHRPPSIVVWAWIVVAIVVVGLAVRVATRPQRWGLAIVVLGASVAAPIAVQVVVGGLGIQARHYLPLAILIPLAAVSLIGRAPADRVRDSSWRVLRVWVGLAPIAMAVALAASLYRYSIGGPGGLTAAWRLLTDAANHWSPPLAALALGSAATIVLVANGLLMAATMGSRPPVQSNEGPSNAGSSPAAGSGGSLPTTRRSDEPSRGRSGE